MSPNARNCSGWWHSTLAQRERIDVLVCNAGVAPHLGPIAEASDQDWEQTMTVNLRSMLWLTSLVIPAMAQRRDGAVILTASLSSLRGNKSIGLYGLSKAGIAQLARNLAVEWGPSNVRVNAISPGVIATEFARPLTEDAPALARRLAQTPLRRIGQPHEIAGVAVMLASPRRRFHHRAESDRRRRHAHQRRQLMGSRFHVSADARRMPCSALPWSWCARSARRCRTAGSTASCSSTAFKAPKVGAADAGGGVPAHPGRGHRRAADRREIHGWRLARAPRRLALMARQRFDPLR
jgi:NADP-dependent 3-hydroxy acid dehydrogenase YdfG